MAYMTIWVYRRGVNYLVITIFMHAIIGSYCTGNQNTKNENLVMNYF